MPWAPVVSGPRPAARQRQARSRSVTTPISRRACTSSTTGMHPQSCACISSATSRTVWSGVQQAGSRVMISCASITSASPEGEWRGLLAARSLPNYLGVGRPRGRQLGDSVQFTLETHQRQPTHDLIELVDRDPVAQVRKPLGDLAPPFVELRPLQPIGPPLEHSPILVSCESGCAAPASVAGPA